MQSHNPSPQEIAKQERRQIITDWIGERLQPEKKVACSGWPKTSLLLVIQHSTITEDEMAAERMAMIAYSNEDCLQRVKHWQGIIKQREDARWLPVTNRMIA